MRETTKQTLAILVITVLLGISLFIFLKFTQPAFNDLNSLKKDISDRIETRNELAKRKQTVIAISEQYASMGETLNKIREALPSKPQLAQILAAIDSIARTTNVIINDISFREITQTSIDMKGKNPYNTIEVSFSLEGNFVSTNSFLAEIEKELRIMDVRQVTMNQYNSIVQTGGKTKTTKSVSTLKTDVVLHTYYQP